MARVLFVDDDTAFTAAIQPLLQADGHEVSVVTSLADGRAFLRSEAVDLLFVDLLLPDGSGLDLLSEDGPAAVIITGHPSLDSAIRAVRGPVIDYLIKPVGRSVLRKCIAKAVNNAATAEADPESNRQLDQAVSDLVGDSAVMRALRQSVLDYGTTDITVLITGESGTGKEVIAQALHDARDPRRPFIALNCGAIPQDLIASELFGHEKGSFTGAATQRKGVFERAGEGTLFLDEIGELPLQQQIALLRVLETRKVQRVGGDREIEVQPRVIAATNRNLEDEVREGRFREDLYFRINVLTLQAPPLRDRAGDVELLAKHFLAAYSSEYGTPTELSPEARAQLLGYQWPGNVRELKNVLLRAAIRNRGQGRVEELPDDFTRAPASAPTDALVPGMSIKDAERSLIEKTLAHFSGNKALTAEALGVSLKTLYNRLKEYETSSTAEEGEA